MLYDVIWRDMVRYGWIWLGMEGCGVAQRDMVGYGVIWLDVVGSGVIYGGLVRYDEMWGHMMGYGWKCCALVCLCDMVRFGAI